MKRRLKEPFGKAGLTVAILALVVGMAGGAYAAGGFSKSQEKQISKIAQKEAKKYAGKPGAPGANGTAGSPGVAGKDGTNGTNGTNGESVTLTESANEIEGHCKGGTTANGKGGTKLQVGAGTPTYACNGKEGSPWTAGGTLPAGKSETGAWIVSDTATAAGQKLSSPVSFAIPLPAASTAHFVGQGEGAGESSENLPEGCAGNVKEPTAEPGFFCAYEAKEFNTNVTSYPFLGGVIQSYVLDPSTSLPNRAGATGAAIVFSSEAEGNAAASGTWAVTAAP